MSCKRCGGAKDINGIGNMPIKCPACNGTGKEIVKLKAEDVIDKVTPSVDAPKATKAKKVVTSKVQSKQKAVSK